MPKKNDLVAPVLKWVGGKRQLIPAITKLLPKKFNNYYEPFIGGGALFFHLQPKNAVINDVNADLINVYQVIKDNPDELIEDLKEHQNTSEYFYNIRNLDRSDEINLLSNIQRASRVLFLNKTCFNGLYRVNNAGEFNTPFGFYKNPNIVNHITIKAVSNYLNTNNINISNIDYADCISDIKKGSFVYFDPPYHPITQTSNFTGYVQGGFNIAEQERLKSVCDLLNSKGISFLLSNSSADFIRDLYKDYTIHTVQATRQINSVAEKRGAVDEVLICNYECTLKKYIAVI
ncbi:MAG: DNA adenine methylase [Sphingobacteriaceae bacterium]|nr:MAG: DNA adenine methylase [Sphingobacteriaceae bacterium]